MCHCLLLYTRQQWADIGVNLLSTPLRAAWASSLHCQAKTRYIAKNMKVPQCESESESARTHKHTPLNIKLLLWACVLFICVQSVTRRTIYLQLLLLHDDLYVCACVCFWQLSSSPVSCVFACVPSHCTVKTDRLFDINILSQRIFYLMLPQLASIKCKLPLGRYI